MRLVSELAPLELCLMGEGEKTLTALSINLNACWNFPFNSDLCCADKKP